MSAAPARLTRAQVQRDERDRLERELLDSVVHQLSVATLQLMINPVGRDADDLRQILTKVADSINAALPELRLLVRLRTPPPARGAASGVDGVDLRTGFDPSAAAAQWRDRLECAGLVSTVAVPMEVDRLPWSFRETITRALDVGCSAILARVPVGATCVIEVELDPAQFVVRVGTSTADEETVVPEAHAVDALGERVALMGGTLRTQASTPEAPFGWVLVLTVPRTQW